MTVTTTAGTPGISHFTRSQLLRTALLFSSDPDLGRRVDLDATTLTRHRLDTTDHLGIWLQVWPPGTDSGWHDHLGSDGAFVVAEGVLTELTHTPTGDDEQQLGAGESRSYGPRHHHALANRGSSPVVSVHAHSPADRAGGRR